MCFVYLYKAHGSMARGYAVCRKRACNPTLEFQLLILLFDPSSRDAPGVFLPTVVYTVLANVSILER